MTPFSEVIANTLVRELTRRRSLDPFAQLEVASHAGWDDLFFAASQLREQYDPRRFHHHGPKAVAAARAICELIQDAFRQLEGAHAATSGG